MDSNGSIKLKRLYQFNFNIFLTVYFIKDNFFLSGMKMLEVGFNIETLRKNFVKINFNL